MPNVNNQFEVYIGDVDPEEDSDYNDADDASEVWVHFECMNRYESDGHVYLMGVASPGGFGVGSQTKSAAVVQLAAPTLLWVADWTARRGGAELMEIPDPNVDDPNWVLLDTHVETSKITVAADGETPIYRISGTYFYANLDPDAQVYKDVRFPLPPYLASAFVRTVPLGSLTKGIATTQDRVLSTQ